MCAAKNGESPQQTTERPLTIAMVVDTFGNRGNGTSNSALQWAQELERQGHHVRLVGVNAPEYPAKVNRVPLVSWVAAKQQMQFAQPSATLFDRAFDGVDIVHIYPPFKFGRHALAAARAQGPPVTAGYHVQPENVTSSAGPLKVVPGADSFIYWLFKHWLYRNVEKQQMQFAQPSATLFDRAFDGVDIVHIYPPFKFGRHALAAARAQGPPVTAGYHVQPENVTSSAGPLKVVPGADSFIYWLFKHWLYRNVDDTPFKFGRHALAAARAKGLPVTAGYHVQPENVTYSAGPLNYVPGADSFIYWLFKHWLYRNVDAIHVPTELGARLFREHHYTAPIHVISNGAVPQRRRDPCADGIGGPVVSRAPLHGADPCDFKRLTGAVHSQAAAPGRRRGWRAVQDRGVGAPVER